MDATCTIQDSIHVFNLVHKYVSRILGTYQFYWGIFRISIYLPNNFCPFFKIVWGNIGICAFFTQLVPISRLVIGGFLDNVKKSPNLFQHSYLQLENFSGKLKIPPTYHRKPVKQSNKNLYAIPQKSL